MKGLIAYCLRRIVRRGCHSCLRWYLSVLSRLIDTLDCYISRLKTFSAGIYARFNFFPSLSAPPSTLVSQSRNLDVHRGGSLSEKGRFYLAPPGVYSQSSDASHETWMTQRWPILMMKVHHRLPGNLWAPSDAELHRHQSVWVNNARQMYLFLRRLLIKPLRRHLDVWDATVLHPRERTHTRTHFCKFTMCEYSDEICNKRLDKSLYCCIALMQI